MINVIKASYAKTSNMKKIGLISFVKVCGAEEMPKCRKTKYVNTIVNHLPTKNKKLSIFWINGYAKVSIL